MNCVYLPLGRLEKLPIAPFLITSSSKNLFTGHLEAIYFLRTGNAMVLVLHYVQLFLQF